LIHGCARQQPSQLRVLAVHSFAASRFHSFYTDKTPDCVCLPRIHLTVYFDQEHWLKATFRTPASPLANKGIVIRAALCHFPPK
jgi:hypothetical protein